MKTHACPVDGCTEVVPNHLLLCASHWRLLPKHLADAVYRTVRLPAMSEARFRAVSEAVSFVNEACSKKSRKIEQEIAEGTEV